MNPLLSKLLENCYSKTGIQKRLRLLRDFSNFWLYQKPQPPLDEAKQKFILSQTGTSDIATAIDLGWFQSIDQSIIQDLDKIEQSVSNCKVVILYLAFDLDPANLIMVGEAIRQQAGPDTILDIKYDPMLLGGCAFSFNGIYKDYSLRALLADQKAQIDQTLTSFKR